MKVDHVFSDYTKTVKSHPSIHPLHSSAQRLLYQVEGVDGNGTVEVLTLYPGIILQFHCFHCKAFHFQESKGIGDGLKLNFCEQGRMEVKMTDHMFLYMEPDQLSIDTRKTQDSFHFPSGHYHGVELLIHSSVTDGAIPGIWNDMGIVPARLQELFCKSNGSYIMRVNERVKALFQSMLTAPESCRVDYLRLKVMELLLLLHHRELPFDSANFSLMTTGQVEIAKQVMVRITSDLSRHDSIHSMAALYGISPSSVKNYFYGVYGKNISTYLKEVRMCAAAHALTQSNQTVAEIAAQNGYENASKFAAAFKNFMGETPLEYRRQSRCGR